MPHIPRVVCVACLVPMENEKNGVTVEMMVQSNEYIYGSSQKKLRPYYKIQADLFKCPNCDQEVISAFAQQPYAEAFKESYDSSTQAEYKVRL